MSHQGMSLLTAYAIGTALGLTVTLGVVGWVADRVGAAESGIRAMVAAPALARAGTRPAAPCGDPSLEASLGRLAGRTRGWL